MRGAVLDRCFQHSWGRCRRRTWWGLAALGAKLIPGFDLISGHLDLKSLIEGSDLVITGEGRLDDQSFSGKVVGGVSQLANQVQVPCVAIVGVADEPLIHELNYVALLQQFGDRSWTDTVACVQETALAVMTDILLTAD